MKDAQTVPHHCRRQGPVPEAWEQPCDPFGWLLGTGRPFSCYLRPLSPIWGSWAIHNSRDFNIVALKQLRPLGLQRCDIGTLEISETFRQNKSLHLTQRMSAVKVRQVFLLRQDICLLLLAQTRRLLLRQDGSKTLRQDRALSCRHLPF